MNFLRNLVCFSFPEFTPPPERVPEEAPKTSLFKRKGAAIGKLASMNFGSKASMEEQKREREEKEMNAERFRKKRESIKKDQEVRKKMSMKMDMIEAELLGRKNDDALSVSSGDSGQVFVHNLMGFWT